MARTRLMIKEWNAELLVQRSTRILEDYAPIIAEEARTQITSVKWMWPNATLRFQSLCMSGQTVQTSRGPRVLILKGDRDIVDTGRLLASQQAPRVADGSLTIAWTAPYAMDVLRGSYPDAYSNPLSRKGTPASNKKRPRNWIGAALDAQPPLPFFVQRWRQLAAERAP
jgi:hypothetical protein